MTDAINTAAGVGGRVEPKAICYHSKLSLQQRDDASACWENPDHDTYCLVATDALGLGLDYNGLTFVHHASPPLSLGMLHQHIGRGRSASTEHEIRCDLFWHPGNYTMARQILKLSHHPDDPQDCSKERELNTLFKTLYFKPAAPAREAAEAEAAPEPQEVAEQVSTRILG